MAGWVVVGCSSGLDEPAAPSAPEEAAPLPLSTGMSPDEPNATAAALAPSGGEDGTDGQVNFGVSESPPNQIDVVCAAQSSASELRSVFLAFALDVSGSMGNDQTRFDQKWSPVIAAAKAFFAEPESAAISASLTFFPVASADTRCTDAAYAAPDVPQTGLPSAAFAAAIDGLNLTATGAWRSSTPTLHAFNGVVGGVQAQSATSANETRAVVLVTDGVPQNCSAEANDVANVAAVVASSGVRTFVIGVDNPPGLGPANLDNLNAIAVAGGTEHAFVVATGDPVQTEANFRAVIDSIRGSALPCSIEIPLPPTGSTFVPEQVNVTYSTTGGDDALLDYDPDCSTASGWHYDAPDQPASIILCADSCGAVQNDVSARLSVEFGCARRSAPR